MFLPPLIGNTEEVTMRTRFIFLAAALLFGLGACTGSMGPGGPASSAYPNSSGHSSGMGGGAGGGGY